MGFSTMNGRLRRIHIPPQFYDYQDSDTMNQNDESKAIVPEIEKLKRIVSFIPSTLPNGLINVYEIDDVNNDDHDCDNSSDKQIRNNQCLEFLIPSMVHRIKDAMIVDHCWTVVVTKPKRQNKQNQQDDEQNEQSTSSTDKCFLVLAVLTRLTKKQQQQQQHTLEHTTSTIENDKLEVCTVSIYSRPIHQNNHTHFDHYSIDCDPNDDLNNPSIWTSSYKINLPYFATCITMDDNILVIGSYIGAKIYKVLDILDHSYSISNSKSKTSNESKYDANDCQIDNNNNNVDDDACCNDRNYSNDNNDSNDSNDNNIKTNIPCIRIMKSCIVQAIHLSYPYFAAATGDRIGIWKIDDIIHSIHTMASSVTCDNRDRNDFSCNNRVAAIWHGKVDNGQSKITCIDMIQCTMNEGYMSYYLALSCWDGSTFVFHHHHFHRNFRRYNHDDHNDDDTTNDCEQCKEEWIRISPRSFQQTDTHHSLPNWEDPPTNENDIIFPSFCKLFQIQYTRYLTPYDSGSSVGMAISCPGKASLQYYDIYTGHSWNHQNFTTIHERGGSCTTKQVNGLERLPSSGLTSELLIWVDEIDNVHFSML